MKSIYCVPLALLIAGCGSSTVSAPQAEPASARVDKAAEADVPLSIVSYDEILERIAKGRGKVVVMDAWSTSCPPCMKEFHNLVELNGKFGADKVQCMSLSFDYEGIGTPEEQRGRVLDFLRSQRATFDNLLSNEESDTLYRKFKLAAVPAVFVYDRQGNLRKRFDNQKAKSKAEQFTYAQVGELVEQLLAESPDGKSRSDDSTSSSTDGPQLP
jgi:thiol-disulfide isomerase/thioredoxin